MRALHFTLGSLALVLAFAGAVLPLLPATPFALLASWSFARSSPRFAPAASLRDFIGRRLDA